MAKPKTTKEIAQRIDPGYFKRWHRLRRTRFLASAVLFGVAVVWVAGAWALGDEALYSNGPVSASHSFIENDCAQCHTESFGPVRDAACLACHQVGQHVPLGSGKHDPACMTCHAEHRDHSRLAAVAALHCDKCHGDHSDIRDFENHVRFKPPEHEQFIRFNHEKHLDKKLLDGPLDCDACHSPGLTGEFRPISFAAHCAECHIDRVTAEVDTVVPHGKQPADLRPWISAVLLAQPDVAATLRNEAAKPAVVPGRGASEVPGWASALKKNTDAAMRALFQKGRGCLFCHTGDATAIQKPDIPVNWLPRARFNHKAHRFESCGTCHQMAKNATAATLSLPTVEVCRTCHEPGGAPDQCAACHPFHPTGHPAAWR